jgi:uncharacterized protein YjbI with pentapeptide repeats
MGERAFCGANLQGQSFKGQNLSGSDFSKADIRGANFTNATLREVNFSGTKAGLQELCCSWNDLIPWLMLSVIPGILAILTGGFAAFLFTPEVTQNLTVIPGVMFLIAIATLLIVILQQGMTLQVFETVAFAFISTITIGVFAAGIIGKNFTNFDVIVLRFFISAVTFAGAAALASAVVFAGAIATASAVARGGTSAIAITIAIAIFLIIAAPTLVISTDALSGVASLIASLLVWLSLYVASKALNEDENYALVHTIAVTFGAISGTSFEGADLTGANLTRAMLGNTSFAHTQTRQTVLTRVCWLGAKDLDRARVGNSILANLKVRELLVSGRGYDKTYEGLNLRGANLTEANLTRANLRRTDLGEASLTRANLEWANLTQVRAVGTDFTEAHLTAACIEAWNIDSTTTLDQADCQHVYLLQGNEERRPSSGTFAPGEFTKLFQEVLNTVVLLFRDGVDWKAFVAAFKQVQVKNEDTPLEIQSIENKRDGMVVIRVSVPPDANKEKIHSEFNQQYEITLRDLETKYLAELQAKEGEIAFHREQNANMWQVINSLANRPINVQAIAEAKAMNESADQNQNFNVGGNFNINATNAVVNLRDISGKVTNAINQLPDCADSNQPNLKELLSQLQQAIETDADLPDADKADLLEQVQNLTEVKQTEEPEKREGLARKVKKMFEATLKSLPETAKIVEACNKLLPIILKTLGLPG